MSTGVRYANTWHREEGLMALIVGVHGMNQQLRGPAVLHKEWWPAIKDGVTAAGGAVTDDTFACAFYGGLFRAAGETRAVGDTHYRPADVTDPFEEELLHHWWAEGAAVEPDRVVSPTAAVRAPTPGSVQAALRALSRSSFFTRVAEHLMIGGLKQVRRYLREPET